MEIKKSTHRTEVVSIHMEPHPNADALSIVRIDNYTICVRTDDWTNGQLAAHIIPDSMVDTSRSEFSFLKTEGRTQERIKARKMRGIYSHGLLIPAPEGAQIGDDVSDLLGVTRYVTPDQVTSGGDHAQPPDGMRPKYDVDSWHKYDKILKNGEQVVISEKIHGSSARYTWQDGQMHVGARANWRKRANGGKENFWWAALDNCPWIQSICRLYPEYTFYGEVFGPVQELKYDRIQVDFVIFDVWHDAESRWLGWKEIKEIFGQEYIDKFWVPILYEGPYIKENAIKLSGGKSTLADHIKEGVVIKPVEERWHDEVGRVQLKLVSNEYLEK